LSAAQDDAQTERQLERQMARALAMRAKGMSEAAIATMLSVSRTTLRDRFVRHDRNARAAAGGAPVARLRLRPRKRPVTIDETLRQRIFAFLADNGAHKNCASQFGVSVDTVARMSMALKRDPTLVVPIEKPEPVWTGARVLMAQRLLRCGVSLSAIARRLTDELEGAPVQPEDLVSRFGREPWPQFRRVVA